MEKEFFTLVLVVFNTALFSQSVKEQHSTPAKVYIIGVVHNENNYRNTDSLLNILINIKPDLILSETDSISGYFKKNRSLATPPNWFTIARKIHLVKKMIPEMEVLYNYKKTNNSVSINPFDIAIPNRSQYVKEYYRNGKKFIADINLAAANNEIPEELIIYHNEYIKSNNWFFTTTLKGYFYLNQKTVSDSIRENFAYEAMYFPKLFKNVPRLSKYKILHIEDATFWKLRNETMSKNILTCIKEKNAKTIVVLTGLMHKYYLSDLLEAAKKENNFELYEFYESGLSR